MQKHALYDVNQSFYYNVATGPKNPPLRLRYKNKSEKFVNFLGFYINNPIGLAACALGLSKGIKLVAELGCGVLTYKTIRSSVCEALPHPNIFFLDRSRQIRAEDINTSIALSYKHQQDNNFIALANSFGNASFDPDQTVQDIAKAKACLRAGQILIVSIYGETLSQIRRAARVASDGGADIIELNCSCPNVSFCSHINLANLECMVRHAVKAAGPNIPVVVKLAYQYYYQLRRSLKIISKAGARGICGINSIPMQVISSHGDEAFLNRKIAGVSGFPIRSLALHFVDHARLIINEEKLDLALMGVGGVTMPQHFDDILNAGADIALSAAAIMFNPLVVAAYIKNYEQKLFSS